MDSPPPPPFLTETKINSLYVSKNIIQKTYNDDEI